MARKTKSGHHQLNMAEELKDILSEFTDEMLNKREIALNKAADYLVKKLEKATPVDTGRTKSSWLRTTKYKGVRYVGNSAVTAKNIPIVNLLEFSKKGKPFVRYTFEENKDEIIKIIKGELNGSTK